MLRALLAAIGVLELVFPHRVVDFWMRPAAEDDVQLRPWVYAAARAEGALILLWVALQSRRDAATRATARPDCW
ncbi:MAG: hypothetical protein ABEJ88_08305 [Halobacterium sp.]